MPANDDKHYPPRIEHVYSFILSAGQTPERIDTYLTEVIPHATRSKVQKAIEEGLVELNGKPTKPGRKVQPGDHITCRVMKLPPLQLVPESIPLEILYEDDVVLVVNKPAGMVTHPGFGNRYGTLVNAVLWHLGMRKALPVTALEQSTAEDEDSDDDNDAQESLSIEDALPDEAQIFASDAIRPGIVHRLDKDTSGILVVSKDIRAHAALARQFAERTARREYYALVWGKVEKDSGTIEGNIGRSPRDRKLFAVLPKGGKPATTDYTVLERFHHVTLLSLRLRTGRTHQIRVHCAHIHHPLFGDAQYGGQSIVYGGNQPIFRSAMIKLLEQMPRQALHARLLGFRHPQTGQLLEFTTPLPEDFERVLTQLRSL